MPEVILVDLRDRPIGTMEKLEAHRRQRLHRAFSVFLWEGDRLLLQKRAAGKYHCGGLWTNSCCSHPAPGESVPGAAARRLREELGIQPPELEELGTFVYRYPFPNGITEFELDHVLLGRWFGTASPEPEEVEALKWVAFDELEQALLEEPERFTPWFLICAPKVIECLRMRR